MSADPFEDLIEGDEELDSEFDGLEFDFDEEFQDPFDYDDDEEEYETEFGGVH